MTEPRKTEKELLSNQAPLINQMGIDIAQERNILNEALRAQLEFIDNELAYYLPSRRSDADPRMPHEWGSLDSYDDVRNSLRFAAFLMDAVLDPLTPTAENQSEQLLELVVDSDCGVCAVDERVFQLAGFKDRSDEALWTKLDAMEERRTER